MIVSMSKTFQMCSIVEGVENKTQLEFIQKIESLKPMDEFIL